MAPIFEVEVKIVLTDSEREHFLLDLKRLGAVYQLDLEHTDIYFNMPKGLRNFVKTDEALRLRKYFEYYLHNSLNDKYITGNKSEYYVQRSKVR